jgi:site-specific DNA-methyltransferase (adenine-specific)
MPAMRRKFALVFADPPFNIKHGYESYEDNMQDYEFELFMQDWIRHAWDRVADGGVLAVHGSIALQPIVWRAVFQLSLAKYFENQIIWTYRFGQCGYGDWVDGHCNCLVFRKPGDRGWYADQILVPSDRATKYKDKRATQGVRSGSRPPGTVWGVPSDGVGWGRVTGNSKERWNKHPNQLPCRYVARIVKGYTKAGDWVLDPFSGSGTTGLVCKHEQRNFIGIDISEFNVNSGRKRIETGYYPGAESSNGEE